ncbi:MAG: hypothetical protein ACK4L4_05835 [Gemmobacter sp.]
MSPPRAPRAEALPRLGDTDGARAALTTAPGRTEDAGLRDWLSRRLAQTVCCHNV